MATSTSMYESTTSACWPIDLRDVPTLLTLLDDQAVAVEIGIAGHASAVAIRAPGVRCRQEGRCVYLEGPESSVFIDLGRLIGARAVCHASGFMRRVSLELAGSDGHDSLTITGPGPSAGIWCSVVEALAPGCREEPGSDGFRPENPDRGL